MKAHIITQIKKAGLVGRGGAEFPVYLKWLAVYRAMSSANHVHCQADSRQEIAYHLHPDQSPRPKVCYVVANGAEGEPGIKKDGYILSEHTEMFLNGLKSALDCLSAKRAYIFLRGDYFENYQDRILKAAAKIGILKKLELVKKPAEVGYIGGEESAVLNMIEGRRAEPRLRPPYPTVSGLFGQPTLINNIETFYDVALVANGDYKGERFFTLNGNLRHPGVFPYRANWSIAKILHASDNYPQRPFFVLVGGDASGEVLTEDQLEVRPRGAGSITVFDLRRHDPRQLMFSWLEFFKNESCGQCVPCREGTLRLFDIAGSARMNWPLFEEILDNLENSSLCALGASLPLPLRSYYKNIYLRYKNKL